MAIYDVSVPLQSRVPTYDAEPGPVLTFRSLIKDGKSANVSALSLGSHTGTHVDAPHHFIDGASTVEAMRPEDLVGPAYVAEFGERRHIGADDLEGMGLPADAKRLLLKTPNAAFWDDPQFHTDFVGLADDAGPWLVRRGFLLVGIDYLSIEQYHSPTHAVHHELLGAGIVIVEGLDLRGVQPGRYTMACAPLKVVGADGAPARVFLWDEPL